MAFSKVTYTDKSTIITAANLNAIQDEIIRLESAKANLSGCTFTGDIKMSATSESYYLIDKTGAQYRGISDNGTNLWLGGHGVQHFGKTIISAGYDSANNTGYPSIYIAVPKANNAGSNVYKVWHNGYVNCNKIYPVGSCYITSTNTNPSTIFPGTTWTMIDKKFKSRTIQDDSAFTINKTNTSSLSSCYISLAGNMLHVRIALKNKVAYSDTTTEVGNVNLAKIGVNGSTYLSWYSSNAYCDGANAIPTFTLNKSTGILNVIQFTGPDPVTTSQTYYFNWICVLPFSNMLDSFCDQFIWKRTA